MNEQSTAYHEAGHAVMAIERQVPFSTVSIIPDGDSVGRVVSGDLPESFQPDIETDARTRRYIEIRVMVMFAGGLPEIMILDQEPEGAWMDHQVAASFVDYLVGGPKSWKPISIGYIFALPQP